MTGFLLGAGIVVAAGAAAVAIAVLRSPLYNEDVTFTPVDGSTAVYFWHCRRCDEFGYVDAIVVDGGGFNHTPKCSAR